MVYVVGSLEARWQLYRLLSEPLRLQILALATEEELSVGELAELLGESQPNVSRHAAVLRQAEVLVDRREGTRTLVRVATESLADPVIVDALGAGKLLCQRDGSLNRIRGVVGARDSRTREFFARPGKAESPLPLVSELPAYLFALGPVLGIRGVALDAGTGEGAFLDVLAPLFERVVALDRSEQQLARAQSRIRARSYQNVELIHDEVDGDAVRERLPNGADVVLCSRMLHHAPVPRETVRALAERVRPGGWLVVIDYVRHEDERFREQQADVWLGFDGEELIQLAQAAGLADPSIRGVPRAWAGAGMDAHLDWQVLLARRGASAAV